MINNKNTSSIDDQMSAVLGPEPKASKPSLAESSIGLGPTIGPKPTTSPYTLQSLFTPIDTPAVKEEEAEVTTAPTPFPFTQETFGGTGLLGTGMPVERKVPIDWTLTTPDLSIKDVLPFDKKEYRELFMGYDEYENAQGEVVNVSGLSIEDRISVADRFGAVRFGIYTEDGRTTADIPWEDAVSKFTRFPEGVQIAGGPLKFDIQGMTMDEYENFVIAQRLSSTMLSPTPELGRAIHAQYLNEVLIKNGIDARGRALIINQEMDEIGVNELGRIVSGASEVVGRGTVELAMWAFGETADWLKWAGEGMGLLRKSDMSNTILDYKGRQGVIDDMWKPSVYRVQDYYAQQNVILDLATAEDLVRAHSGMLPRVIGLAIELKTPTKAVLIRQGLVAQGEVRAFQSWRKGKLQSDPNMTEDALLDEWKANRRALFGLKGARKSTIDNRFVLAYQIDDSLLPVAERANVVQQRSYLRGLYNQRDAASRKFKDGQENPKLNEAQITDLRKKVIDVDNRIQQAEYDMFSIQRKSSVPRFVRDSNIQDKYVIVGSAIGGHYFEDFNDEVDPELGELLGIGAGIAVYFAQGLSSPALNAIKSRIPTRDKRRKLEFITDKISQQNPSVQIAIQQQAEKISLYKQKLIDLGVDPDVLDTPLQIVTDLMVLRHFSETTQQRIKISETLNPEVVKDLQETADINYRLSAELNRVIDEMRGLESGEATQALMDMLDYFRREAKEGNDKLKAYLKTIDTEGIGHYMNALSGNSAAVAGKGPLVQDNTDVLSFPEAVDALHTRNLAEPVSSDEISNLIDDHDNFVNTEVRTAAHDIVSKAGDVNSVRLSFEDAEDVSIPSGITPGGLFSFVLENAHSSAKAKAQAPYIQLNNATLLSTSGDEFAQGSLTVDVNNVLDDLFGIAEEVLPLTRKEGKGIRDSDLKLFDTTLEKITDSFFDSMSQANGTSKDKFINGLLEGINKKRKQLNLGPLEVPKNRSKQVIVAKAMLEYSDIDAFRVSPSTLREMQQSLNQMRYRYRNNADAQMRFEGVDQLISSKFDEFEADGVPIDKLFIIDANGARKPLVEYMDEARIGYEQYKANWYDLNEDAVIPKLMSWGNRRNTDTNAENPTGVRYNKLTSQWLNPADYADKNASEKLMRSINRTLGRKRPLANGTESYRLTLGEGNTDTVRSILSADIGRYISENIDSMSTDDIIDYANKVDNNIRAVDEAGNDVPLVNVVAIIDEVLKASSKTYKKDLWEAATASVDKKIEDAIAVSTRKARSQSNATEAALDVLTETYGKNMSLREFGRLISAGNQNDIRQFKKVLSDATVMSDYLKVMSVDDILAQAYLEYMQTSIFVTTGRKLGSKKTGTDGKEVFSLIEEVTTDPSALKVALGGDDPARREAVKMIIGEERYEVWQVMSDYLAELNDNPLARNPSVIMQGAPRSLSIESYISRLYAINRKVVRPQYVGTEATIQALRNKQFNFLVAALTDPELGNLLVEMLRTGKPLSEKKNIRLEQLLIQSYGQQIGLEGGIKETPIVDAAGRVFTHKATRKQRERFIGDSRIEGQLDIPSLDVIP